MFRFKGKNNPNPVKPKYVATTDVLVDNPVTAKRSKYYLPTIDLSMFTKNSCTTKNCSEHTTTALANILGVNRDKISEEVAGDAWYKRSKTLSTGGEDVWNIKSGKLNYDTLQVGDFVSLSRRGRARAEVEAPKQKDNLAKESYGSKHVAHSGIIIGKDDKGIPIIEHNISGKIYREPITKINKNGFATYKPTSIFRSKAAATSDFKDYKKFVLGQHNASQSLDIDMSYGSKIKTGVFDSYVKNRKDIVKSLNIPTYAADRIFNNLYGISAQESNVDNDLPAPTFRHKLSEAKQFIKDITPEFINQGAKFVNDVLNIEKEGSGLSSWEIEMQAANRATVNGVFHSDLYQSLLSDYKKSKLDTGVTPKSKGAFKQKEVSPTANRRFGLKDELIPIGKFKKTDAFRTTDNQVKNAFGLYVENLSKAKELYPDESEEVLHKIATLAHNAPSKAFNKNYVDFYIKGNNPNPTKFKSDYLQKVQQYKKDLTGMERFQKGGYRYKNPYDFMEYAQDALALPISYATGIEMGESLGYNEESQKRLGTIELLNNTMRFGAKHLNERRRREEEIARQRQTELDSYQNVDYDYYDSYNPHLTAKQTDMFKYGGKLNPNKSNKIIQALKPIYEHNQPLKNSSDNRDFANLFGFQPAQEVLEARNKSDIKVKPFKNSKYPKEDRSTEYRYYKYDSQSPNKYTTEISPRGYHDNPSADSYMVPTDGSITMRDVPEAMLGMSVDTGETKLMMPNEDYFFENTKMVFEKPLKKLTGKFKAKRK